jgi:hypothetical protein
MRAIQETEKKRKQKTREILLIGNCHTTIYQTIFIKIQRVIIAGDNNKKMTK